MHVGGSRPSKTSPKFNEKTYRERKSKNEGGRGKKEQTSGRSGGGASCGGGSGAGVPGRGVGGLEGCSAGGGSGGGGSCAAEEMNNKFTNLNFEKNIHNVQKSKIFQKKKETKKKSQK